MGIESWTHGRVTVKATGTSATWMDARSLERLGVQVATVNVESKAVTILLLEANATALKEIARLAVRERNLVYLLRVTLVLGMRNTGAAFLESKSKRVRRSVRLLPVLWRLTRNPMRVSRWEMFVPSR